MFSLCNDNLTTPSSTFSLSPLNHLTYPCVTSPSPPPILYSFVSSPVPSLSHLSPVELAMIMDRLYGGVCYAGIDTDPELKYPKGAGRVAFSNQQSYIAAISARFVQLQHGEMDKRVSQSDLW